VSTSGGGKKSTLEKAGGESRSTTMRRTTYDTSGSLLTRLHVGGETRCIGASDFCANRRVGTSQTPLYSYLYQIFWAKKFNLPSAILATYTFAKPHFTPPSRPPALTHPHPLLNASLFSFLIFPRLCSPLCFVSFLPLINIPSVIYFTFNLSVCAGQK
jgi:hypothetical protein